MTEGNPHLHDYLQTPTTEALYTIFIILLHNLGLKD